MNSVLDHSFGPFYDNKNFPYGFSRSGDFTIKEAEILQNIGRYYSHIMTSSIEALSPDEKQLLDVMNGKAESRSIEERIWLKYLSLINRKQIWLVDSAKSKTNSGSNEPGDDNVIEGLDNMDDFYVDDD